jgi:hypothetical protein
MVNLKQKANFQEKMMKIWTAGTLTVKSIQQQKKYHNLVVNQNIPRMTFLSLHRITMFDNKVLATRQTDWEEPASTFFSI